MERCKFIKVLAKVRKVCSLTGVQGQREGKAYEGVENPVSPSGITQNPPGLRLVGGGETGASAKRGLCRQ